MNTAVTAMNGMSGRKKVCQRSSPPSARNVTMISTVAAQAVTKQQCLVSESAAGQDGLDGGLAHDP